MEEHIRRPRLNCYCIVSHKPVVLANFIWLGNFNYETLECNEKQKKDGQVLCMRSGLECRLYDRFFRG